MVRSFVFPSLLAAYIAAQTGALVAGLQQESIVLWALLFWSWLAGSLTSAFVAYALYRVEKRDYRSDYQVVTAYAKVVFLSPLWLFLFVITVGYLIVVFVRFVVRAFKPGRRTLFKDAFRSGRE